MRLEKQDIRDHRLNTLQALIPRANLLRGVPMTLREAQYGIVPYLATGKVLPDDTVEAMEESDAILWGATGGPETKEVPPAARKAGSWIGNTARR